MLKYLPGRVVLAVAGLISIPVVTRLFEPNAYGDYILVISLVRVLNLSAGWISGSIIRFYPEFEVKQDTAGFSATVSRMLGGWLLAVGTLYAISICAFHNWLGGGMCKLLWLGLPLFCLATIYDTLLEFLRAKRLLAEYTVYVVWRSAAGLAFGISIAYFLITRVEALLYGGIACLLMALPTLWRSALEGVPVVRGCGSRALTRELATYGVPSVVSNLSAWVLGLSDRYMIGFFRPRAEVGIYAASFSIGEYTLSLVANLFGLTSGTIVFNLWEKEGEANAKAFMTKITRYYLIVSVPAAVGLSLLAEPIISLITAKQYHDGYKVVPFVVIGALLLGLQQRFYSGINIVKKNWIIMVSILAGALLSVCANWIFIPKHGYMAAAVAMVASNALLLMLIVVLSRRYIVWPFPAATLLRVCLASAGMAAGVVGLRNWSLGYLWADLVVAVLAGAGIYFAVLCLLREYDAAFVKRALGLVAFKIGGGTDPGA